MEYYNEETSEFVSVKSTRIELEHSLISLSKWESRWNKPFLGKEQKTTEEVNDYIRCMMMTRNVPLGIEKTLTEKQLGQINDYINAPMTATTFSKFQQQAPSREVITSELIYYWMVALNIPFECQKWHLNRLLTLIRVCSIKNTPAKQMSKTAVIERNRALNAARRKRLNTKG